MAQEPLKPNRGVTLIIVVFAMMLLGVLGWTLARMQAIDFESSLRTFEPENALNLAEAGSQWALNRLATDSTCRTQSGLLRCPPLASPAIDTDCNDNGDWMSSPHNLSPGQYNLCLRPPCTACVPAEGGDAVIVARGYIPAQSGSRVMRQVKIEVDIGSLTNALQTQVPDPDDQSRGLFSWSAANNQPPAVPVHNPVRIEGTISVGHYEGDGDGLYDELPPGDPGYDYDPPPSPILPDDNNNPENDIRDFTASYPSINMLDFYNIATNRWPTAGRILNATVMIIAGGNRLQGSAGFFNSANDPNRVAVKRQNGSLNNDNDWTIITGVLGGGGIAIVSPNVAAWPDEDLLTPGIQVAIKLVRRFYQDAVSQRWYIGRQIAGEETADALIDLSSSNIDLTQTSIVSEGDIVINGGRRLRMRFFGLPFLTRYPNLATQNGNIFSTDQPNGGNENSRRDQRRFEGLLYSQNGEVNFNYLDGTMVYGNQITLDGTVRIRYQSNRVSSSGFVFEPTTLKWKEE